MVKLNKIYTRTGDGGETSLVNGRRVAKHSRRPSAFGEVDEANSVIGLARLHCEGAADEMLGRIQNDLFDLGADLATPDSDAPALRITANQVERLEAEIDALNANLQPLNSFILPGGDAGAAWLHLGRTVVRRAERLMTMLAGEEVVNENAMKYINRLSDHLFVLARTLNDGGKTDILWRPGQNSSQDSDQN
ncbi:cob(I)yrinic acid a,c-diamide adenosyltransferase [Alphaproteobacteria bacterium]|jgi:cob(I)alamin adenosyltransferase|nr:cob(I)yrinic acid a,c-diamide adenosyltransferase [Alphaproteobacteria bacterium]NCF49246.1 cob(I)yrinic acid a,c-diamide adenosyltransferase [Bacteroidota bacterium]